MVVFIGAWMASRQSLSIATGISAQGVERAVNWWGLAIALGLLVGGVGGLAGVLTRRPHVLVGSALVTMVSGVWHPLLWPAVVAALPVLLLGSVSTDGTSRPP